MAVTRERSLSFQDHAAVSMPGTDGEWIEIQQKTFINWVNEQLRESGRKIEQLAEDFADGVNLVALVEALQFKKIGKVYPKPTNRIQMIENVSLAYKAISDDNIKLVNIGNEDIVNGNLKLILGLLWRLILRYQISKEKTKVPPKKLMLQWFKSVMPELNINNFNANWNDGIALHALLDYCKPGASPNWRQLQSRNSVENCRSAMVLAKEQLQIPRMINPEDFASSRLDELSAMTYLSYFLKSKSPGYYATLNWACKQLRTTTITNLTTDWNDGYYLCSIVHSMGGNIPDWPNIDRSDHLGNCQRGIDAAAEIGVEPLISAKYLSDPKIDHLSVMAYLATFLNPKSEKKPKQPKLSLKCTTQRALRGEQISYQVTSTGGVPDKSKFSTQVNGPSTTPSIEVSWGDNLATCSFHSQESGVHQITAKYNGEEVAGSPYTVTIRPDVSKVQLLSQSCSCVVGKTVNILIDTNGAGSGDMKIDAIATSGQKDSLESEEKQGKYTSVFMPKYVGVWTVKVTYEGHEVGGSPVTFDAYDPEKVVLTAPDAGEVGEEITCLVNCKHAGNGSISADVTQGQVQVEPKSGSDKVYAVRFTPTQAGKLLFTAKFNGIIIPGCPMTIVVSDPSTITVTGDGLIKGKIGHVGSFDVNTAGMKGDIGVDIMVNGKPVNANWKSVGNGQFQFRYTPQIAGEYVIAVNWNKKHVTGSPFRCKVVDHRGVNIVSNLDELRDEDQRLALPTGVPYHLLFDVQKAGPGIFTSEVLSPNGRLPVDIKQDYKVVDISFVPKEEGSHYINLFWSDAPLKESPILGYCPGPQLALNSGKVLVTGSGCSEARATIPAEFAINGRQAGPGVPSVTMKSVKTSIDVNIKSTHYDRYNCTYTAPTAGGYLLYVTWSGKEVPGVPFKVTVSPKGRAGKVNVSGDGLRGGLLGREMKVIVDAREAGPGNVAATCAGLNRAAQCDVSVMQPNIYLLRILPAEAGPHALQIQYDDEDVPGSPFGMRVIEPPDPSKVKVFGPGILSGVIHTYQSRFIVDTKGAGGGQVSVKIRGPKAAFNVEIQRESDSDRTINCKYNPTEPGLYVINVRWSGTHVPGSPFSVHIFESRKDLNNHLRSTGATQSSMKNKGQWTEDI